MTGAHEPSWSDRVDGALERVGWAVLERAEQTGTPIITWEGGKVVELPPQVLRERLQQTDESRLRS
jgi:hypothetical protein